MVLKTGLDQLVRPSIGHDSGPVRLIGPGSNRTGIEPFEPAVRLTNRTNWSIPFEPNISFSFPFPLSPCDWYQHCHLERCPADNGTSTVAWSIIPLAAPPALGTPPPTADCKTPLSLSLPHDWKPFSLSLSPHDWKNYLPFSF